MEYFFPMYHTFLLLQRKIHRIILSRTAEKKVKLKKRN